MMMTCRQFREDLHQQKLQLQQVKVKTKKFEEDLKRHSEEKQRNDVALRKLRQSINTIDMVMSVIILLFLFVYLLLSAFSFLRQVRPALLLWPFCVQFSVSHIMLANHCIRSPCSDLYLPRICLISY